MLYFSSVLTNKNVRYLVKFPPRPSVSGAQQNNKMRDCQEGWDGTSHGAFAPKKTKSRSIGRRYYRQSTFDGEQQNKRFFKAVFQYVKILHILKVSHLALITIFSFSSVFFKRFIFFA
eukprot:GEMP01089295.1.p1 GENE.GEMP01089295.1~~GEMP01089295.1.p1  ORF type:complete len:118 (-),score=4.01 GEMP01089295.1:543-896(-)